MSTTLEEIGAGDVSRILAEQCIQKHNPATVLIDQDVGEFARRIRAKAKANLVWNPPAHRAHTSILSVLVRPRSIS